MVTRTRQTVLPAVIVAVSLLALDGPASAQYFGRNKVQYKKFDFQILKTEHFDIYFYPGEREAIDVSARLAERWHALQVGGSLTVEWPRPEGRRRHPPRERRRPTATRQR